MTEIWGWGVAKKRAKKEQEAAEKGKMLYWI